MNPHLEKYLASLGIPKTQAELAIKGWTVSIAKRDGKEVAIVLTLGTEIHFVSLGGSAMTRKNTLEFLRPIHEIHGYVTTRTPLAETNDKLRSVLGFKFQWADEQYKYWAMTVLPFSKAKP